MNSNGKGWLILVLFVASAASGLATDNPVGSAASEAVLAPPQPEPWGGAQDTVIVIGPHTSLPPSDAVTWNTSVSGSTGLALYQTSATSIDWWQLVHIPSGAMLQRLELEACDLSLTAGIQFGMFRGGVPGLTAFNIINTATTGIAPAPGCAIYAATPAAPTTIDNRNYNYWIFFDWSGTGFSTLTRINSFRVYYRLQVSPAPATATFPNDVPTSHPFFRFVEAMARSGLTGGCSAGSFCPDSPVTRGQMSVFLASALGLHFSP